MWKVLSFPLDRFRSIAATAVNGCPNNLQMIYGSSHPHSGAAGMQSCPPVPNRVGQSVLLEYVLDVCKP